jgi:plasmid stability protein
MTTLTVRNVPEARIRALKERARRHGRSMEEELRQIIDESTRSLDEVCQAIEATWAQQARPTDATEVDRWLRESRP